MLALLVRTLAALPQQQPNYMDAAYSYVNALNLAQGRGFVEDFVWNYLGDPGPPPQPSHLYWMPLTSLLAAAGMLVGGLSYRAAQIPFILLSALLAPISYHVARLLAETTPRSGNRDKITKGEDTPSSPLRLPKFWDAPRQLGSQRRLAWLAGLLAIFSGFYMPFWTAIDNFTPFAVTGSLALLLAWQGSEGARDTVQNPEGKVHHSSLITRYSSLFLAGLLAGLAHLARADGLLLLLTILAFIAWHMIKSPSLTLQPSSLILVMLGYLLIMTPWFIRNWQVAGSPLPAAGSQTIWLAGYDDLFSYGRELSLRAFLAQGWTAAAQGRLWALSVNLQTVAAVWGMIFLTPLVMVGGWQRRRHGLAQLAGLYALLLFGVMTLVFPFPGARGGLFHSGAALLPFIYGLAVVGLDEAVGWAAARRRSWNAPAARRVFGLGLIVLAIGLSGFIYNQRVLKNNAWNRADSAYPAIAAWVAGQEPAALVMIGNPPAYRYHGGGLSVVIPNEKLETTLAAARRYGVRYLILEPNHPAPLNELFQNPDHQPGLRLVTTFGDTLVFEVTSKE